MHKDAPDEAGSPYSRGVRAFGVFLSGLVRFGWFPLVGVLLIAWLLEWAPWRTLLAIGIACALVILVSPVVYGVAIAIDSRRRARRRGSDAAPPVSKSVNGPEES